MAAVIPAVTKLSSRVIRVLGCNPGLMTLQGTNTYIIGTGRRRILVDTGEADNPQYINHLRYALKHENIELAHIIITHWHHDHIGGLTDVLDIKGKSRNVQVWKYPLAGGAISTIVPIQDLKDGKEISVEGSTIRIVHTPGHTRDHVALHLLEDNVIFSGDCILGEGSAIFEDLHDYMTSLKCILDIEPSTIYPGHGNVINNPIERIKYYMAHRQEREEQILAVLNNNRRQFFTEEDLVKIIYIETPEKLWKAAARNVNHHLHKLLKEDKVHQEDNMWSFKICC